MIDLTNYQELSKEPIARVLVTVSLRLDKKTMVDILSTDKIIIGEDIFKVPENEVLQLLLSKKYGIHRIELELTT